MTFFVNLVSEILLSHFPYFSSVTHVYRYLLNYFNHNLLFNIMLYFFGSSWFRANLTYGCSEVQETNPKSKKAKPKS